MLVGIMLGSRPPMLVVRGARRTTLYDDGYALMCGERHPAVLGRPFEDLWFDIWPLVEPILSRAYVGESTYIDDITFTMHRNGYLDETHFAFFQTPVIVGDESVGGLFCACYAPQGGGGGESQPAAPSPAVAVFRRRPVRTDACLRIRQ